MSGATSLDTRAQRVGLAFAIIGAFLFALKPILIKWMYSQGITSLPLLWLRMGLVLPMFVGLWLWVHKRRVQKGHRVVLRHVVYAWLTGLLGYYLASFLDLWGLEYVSSQLERLVLYAYPSLVIVFGVWFFREPWHKRYGVALVLTYSGLLFIYGHDVHVSSDLASLTQGTLLVLASAVSFALYVLLGKSSIKNLGSLLFSAIAMTSACVATAIHYALVHGFYFPPLTPSLWVGGVALAFFITFLPILFINEAIHRIGAQRTSISGMVGPVFTTVLAAWWLSEPVTLWSLLGMVLVMSGVFLLSRKPA